MRKLVASVIGCMCGALCAADVALTAENNVDKTEIALQEGDRLIVPAPSVAGGKYDIKVRVRVNGSATLALPTEVAYDDVILSGGLASSGDAVLTVEGGSILFGSRTKVSQTEVDFPRFDSQLAFSTPGAGVTFTNAVTLHKMPADDIPVTIAKDTLLALRGKNVFTRFMDMSGEHPAFTATKDYTVHMHNEDAFPYGTVVTVKPGAKFGFKFCADKLDEAEEHRFWKWSGVASQNVTNITSVVLESTETERAQVLDLCRKALYLYADISGEGDFRHDGQPIANEDRTYLRGNLTFKGEIRISGSNAAVYFCQETPGDASNAIVCETRARVGFEGVTGKAYPTNIRIASFSSTDGGTQIWVNGNQTITIGESRGNWMMSGGGPATLCKVVIENLVSGTLYQYASVGLTILHRTAGSVVSLPSDGRMRGLIDFSECAGEWPFPYEVRANTQMEVIGKEDGTLLLSGEGELSSVTGGMTVVPKEEKMSVEVPSGSSVTIGVVTDETNASWAQKVDLWFDASKPETYIMYPDNTCYTNGYPLVIGWGDRRKMFSDRYLFNGRTFQGQTYPTFGDRHDEVNPFVVTNGLNGMNYISMGAYDNYIHNNYQNPSYSGSGTIREARRFILIDGEPRAINDPSAHSVAAYAIMVYGSQQGGGRAVLGATGGTFIRNTKVTDPFFISYETTINVNGVACDGKATAPDGDWQILSFPLNGALVNAVGWCNGFANSGGANYAEVILFASTPTENERKACENYLAKKWGLVGKLAAGGSYLPSVNLHGAGNVTLADDTQITGGFAGTVTVPEGVILTVSHNPPPGEEVVPEANRVLWFDPDFEGSLVRHSSTDPRVSRVNPRNANGLVGGTAALSGLKGTDRCPWAETVARGNGEIRTWLNFSNVIPGDTAGNTLRHQLNHSANSTTADSFGNVREGFMVLDTTNGGGTPIGDEVNMNSTSRDNGGSVVSKPIWKNDTGVFEGIETRLDDVKLNGNAIGFSGRPEVMEFKITAKNPWQPKFFGAYLGHNDEIIGESIFYSQALSDEQRSKVTAYLAWKWFGKVLAGHSLLSRMTVTGAGRVEVGDVANMPNFASDFSGVVACMADEYAFALDPAASREAASDMIQVSAPFEIASGATIDISCNGKLRSGEYKLIGGDVRFANGAMPAINMTGIDLGNFEVAPVLKPDGLFLSVKSPLGFMLIVR